MKKILLSAFGVLGLCTVTVISLLQAGAIDIAADNPHSPAVHRLIEWAREQSIARRAANIVPPDDLSNAGRIRRSAGNYDAMCANCHLSPGIEDSEIRKGLYPTAPNLSKPTNTNDSDRTDARRFWIIKHGIKASGMPAWSKGGMEDEAIWDLTAFLKIT
jgi:mono/diheme cytochrome c family protein